MRRFPLAYDAVDGEQLVAEVGLERIVPGHCTGWRATHRLATAFPDAFVQPSVGTVLRF